MSVLSLKSVDRLTIVIDRQESMNSLDKKTFSEFGKAVRDGLDDRTVRGIIITGAGNKAFVSGADIREFLQFDPETAYAMSRNGQRVLEMIERADKPIIAAVNGLALGGGCELAMACHLRLAADHAFFGQPEINLGIIPGFGGTQRLTRLIGKTRALEWMLTGHKASAQEAERLGLVNLVCSWENLLPNANKLMDAIVSKSPTACRALLRAVKDCDLSESEGYESESSQFRECFKDEKFIEGMNAFLEKRKPDFSK